VTVTLPNAVPIWPVWSAFDYGFTGQTAIPAQGTTNAADGVSWRQPDDGARIEVVGTTQGLWFYRADLNEWVNAYDIRLDDEVPVNQRYAGPLGAFLAERLEDELSTSEPSPSVARRAALARAALFIRPGVARQPVRGEYL
jgi:hypothetical protein